MARWLGIGVVAWGGLLCTDAHAIDVVCTSNLGNVDIKGNLNVVGRCRLSGTDVNGNVKMFAGGSLTARNARIRGNLDGHRADFVDIDNSRVDGNVKLDELVGDSSTIRRTQFGGNVALRKNRSRLEILNNDVERNVEVMDNTGGVLISGNSIERNLRCNGNRPRPTGIGNKVDGRREGQCKDLGAPSGPSQPPPAQPPPPQPPAASQPPPARPPPTTTQPPPTTSQPQPTTPPPRPPTSSQPPPTTSQPPPTTPRPPTITQPPPVTSQPPPATSTPPTTTLSPPSSPPVQTEFVSQPNGGGGALTWPYALALALLAWVRARRRH